MPRIVLVRRVAAALLQFESLVHASLDGYWFRFNTGSVVVDNSDFFTVGQVSYSSGVVSLDVNDLDRSGLAASTTYSIEVRTQQTVGGTVVYGPWSDTGADYTTA